MSCIENVSEVISKSKISVYSFIVVNKHKHFFVSFNFENSIRLSGKSIPWDPV